MLLFFIVRCFLFLNRAGYNYLLVPLSQFQQVTDKKYNNIIYIYTALVDYKYTIYSIYRNCIVYNTIYSVYIAYILY